LDTGIDHSHPFFSDDEKIARLVACESFLDCSNPNSVKDMPRKAKDAHGHGTHIAGIILQAALDADLYISQVVVGEDPTQNDAQQISKLQW
jgi:subtilisin family serine protease